VMLGSAAREHAIAVRDERLHRRRVRSVKRNTGDRPPQSRSPAPPDRSRRPPHGRRRRQWLSAASAREHGVLVATAMDKLERRTTGRMMIESQLM
jgi:hypothetical protein